jgi:hypothetical protein
MIRRQETEIVFPEASSDWGSIDHHDPRIWSGPHLAVRECRRREPDWGSFSIFVVLADELAGCTFRLLKVDAGVPLSPVKDSDRFASQGIHRRGRNIYAFGNYL